jgi:hypothetical protein
MIMPWLKQSNFFLTENSEGDPAVVILLKEKIFTKEENPDYYKFTTQLEKLSYWANKIEKKLNY